MEKYKSELKNFFTEHWRYLAIHAACKIHLFDAIDEKPTDNEQIRIKLGIREPLWAALFRICKMEGLISGDSPVLLTAKGRLLTKSHPESLLFACLHWGEEHLSAWQALSFTIQTGKSSFEHLFGMPYFQYLSANPDRLNLYHLAMNEYARDDYMDICQKFDFSPFRTILDVGGGYGALIKRIKAGYPSANCLLLDLPEVVKNAHLDGIDVLGSSFFDPLPGSYDCIILSRILHDWPDEEAKTILGNCLQALSSNGVLLLIEILADRIDHTPDLLTLNMFAICSSEERSFFQYKTLLEHAGLSISEAIPVNDLQHIIVARK